MDFVLFGPQPNATTFWTDAKFEFRLIFDMIKILYLTLPLAWFALPTVAWAVNALNYKRLHPMIVFGISSILGYLLILTSVWVADTHLYAEMNKFDLDGDGSISGIESTTEAAEAQDRWASDTGRSFAPIIGFPLSVIWSGVCLTFLYLGEAAINLLFGKQAQTDPESID